MKKKSTRAVIALLLILTMFTALMTGCGRKENGDLTPVTLNEVAHSVFYAPMYVAIEEGYFADEGIDLTLVTGYGADKTMTALLSGEASGYVPYTAFCALQSYMEENPDVIQGFTNAL